MKLNLNHDFDVAKVGTIGVIFGMAFGFFISQPNELHTAPSTTSGSVPEPQMQVYDCDNFAYAPSDAQSNPEHPAYYALQRLQYACAQNEAMVAILKIWESDPMAGVVYEPAPE